MVSVVVIWVWPAIDSLGPTALTVEASTTQSIDSPHSGITRHESQDRPPKSEYTTSRVVK
jgi:hypothetical protein